MAIAINGVQIIDIQTPGVQILRPSGDLDDYFEFSVTANRPLFRAIGSYLVLGADGTPGSAIADGDIFIKQRLEVDGISYFDSAVYIRNHSYVSLDKMLSYGTAYECAISLNTLDANAKSAYMRMIAGDATDVPVFVVGAPYATDWGLFDGVTQPSFTFLEKSNQLHTATDGIADAGGATAILKHVGGFTNGVVGDDVRITAGTNCTPGWYTIITRTSADQVTLDRNYASNNSTNVTFVTYHPFSILSAQGVRTLVTYGAPPAREIAAAGWLALDVSIANGRLYWTIGNGVAHYVDATAGLSLPKEERIDPTGHTFQIGDEVKLIVDRINDDGSFHAYPYYAS